MLKRKGLLLILSSASGAGKTSVAKAILAGDDNISLSVSVTTRPARPNEVHGRDYYFITKPEFDRMVLAEELLEHAEVFGHFYGTPRVPVESALMLGRDMLFDIDWQGTQQLGEAMPHDIVKIFILPPSKQELEQRLWRRAEDSPEVVRARMQKASQELSHYLEYDFIVVNDQLDQAVQGVRAILQSERARRTRYFDLYDFVQELS